jgi:lipoyl(octanoyl) transferase
VPPEVAPLRWRILREPPAGGAWNMAVDEALARCRAPGEGTLRIYRWARPTLSFGRNQPARGRYDESVAPLIGAEVVRRPTGGREVLHDRELTYAIILPLRSLGGLREAYAEVNAGLVDALRSLGVPAEAAPRRGRPPGPEAGACFAVAAPGEVTVGGRKLVGSAQARVEGSLLQHGSLLLGPPSLSLEAFRAPPTSQSAGEMSGGAMGEGAQVSGLEGAVTLQEILGSEGGRGGDSTRVGGGAGGVSFPVVAGAVESALAGRFGGEWRRDELREEERVVARSLLPHYQSTSWTWRR